MRQIICAGTGGPEVLQPQETASPHPASGEVRIRVAAAGMNRADIAQRDGSYPVPTGGSAVPGLEVAGIVDAVGDGVHGVALGDAVCCLTPGGGYAEQVCVPAVLCLPVPAGFSMAQAAALPEAAMTVWSNLFGHGRLASGESVLVHGGTSGVGSFALQLLIALGHPAAATAGSAVKCDAIRSWKAHAIAYRDSDFVDDALAWTQGRGVDVVLDMIGGDYLDRSLRCLARGGRLVQIAFQSGRHARIDLLEVVRKEAVLTGSLLRPRPLPEKVAIVQALRGQVWPLLAEGRQPAPVIDRVFPMSEVQAAHAWMEQGAHIGKIVLRWAPDGAGQVD